MGLIDSLQGDGTYVRSLNPEELTEPLALCLLQSQTQMRELWEARRILEPVLAELAATRITAEEIDELEATLQTQRHQVELGFMGLEEDTAFHYGIARAAGNGVMLRVMDTLVDLLRQSRERALQQRDRPAHSLAGHVRILTALRDRDSLAARACMLTHVREIEELIFTQLAQDGGARS
jgi:GntR family transcriptional repressor for pyruvate dehydrogenase complex